MRLKLAETGIVPVLTKCQAQTITGSNNKMRTIRTKVFQFNELNTEAKQKAIEDYRNENTEVFWADENKDTLNAFADLFPVKIKNWSYGDRGEGVYFTFTESDEIENLTGVRLATYIWNNYRTDIYTAKQYWICNGTHNCVGKDAKHRNSKIFITEFGCPFTGYCMDNEIIAPLFDFMRKPDKNTNFKDLLENCFNAWIKACNNDIEDQNSDEYISDHITANEYEFTKEGRRF